jgi:hypothetical protein
MNGKSGPIIRQHSSVVPFWKLPVVEGYKNFGAGGGTQTIDPPRP